jgi:hypothetical protein
LINGLVLGGTRAADDVAATQRQSIHREMKKTNQKELRTIYAPFTILIVRYPTKLLFKSTPAVSNIDQRYCKFNV